jgi:ketosteroid isomerase-like protein
VFTGPEGMKGFAAASAEAWEEFLFVPIAFTPLGDRLLVDLEVRGVGRESGIVLEENWAHLYTITGGRIARFEAFRSRDEALEALAYPDRS